MTESKPELRLPFRFRVTMLFLLIFSAGVSLPISGLKDTFAQLSTGQTGIFFSILWDVLTRPPVFQNVITHPDATASIFRYFQTGENFNNSAWWLEHREGLLQLFSDGDTYSIIGNNPWLFGILREVNQTYPAAYGTMLNNRHFFNTILRQVVAHQEFQVIFTHHPEYLPLIYNLTFSQPFDQAWTRFIHPLQNATIGNVTLVVIFTLSLTTINQTLLTLIRYVPPGREILGRGDVIYNATLNMTGLPEGQYYLWVRVTLTSGIVLQDLIRVNYSKTFIGSA